VLRGPPTSSVEPASHNDADLHRRSDAANATPEAKPSSAQAASQDRQPKSEGKPAPPSGPVQMETGEAAASAAALEAAAAENAEALEVGDLTATLDARLPPAERLAQGRASLATRDTDATLPDENTDGAVRGPVLLEFARSQGSNHAPFGATVHASL